MSFPNGQLLQEMGSKLYDDSNPCRYFSMFMYQVLWSKYEARLFECITINALKHSYLVIIFYHDAD